MRKSNLQFAKGSIIYAHIEQGHRFSFLGNKPLVVISNPIRLFDSVTVVATGSKGDPGIKCSFYNYLSGEYVGGHEETTIYPYSIFTIPTSTIRTCIGVLDPYIMKEVDAAVDFFLGRTEKIPAFMIPQDVASQRTLTPEEKAMQDLFGVEFTYSNKGFSMNEKVNAETVRYIVQEDTDEVAPSGLSRAIGMGDHFRTISFIEDGDLCKIVTNSIKSNELAQKYKINGAASKTMINLVLKGAMRRGAAIYQQLDEKGTLCNDEYSRLHPLFDKLSLLIYYRYLLSLNTEVRKSVMNVIYGATAEVIDIYNPDFTDARRWRRLYRFG